MSNPLVSIIMPAYNVEKYIQESINSVIKQSYENWELIVIDDNSNDGTNDIIKKIALKDKRIKPIFLKHNSGKPSIAKNYAYDIVSGDFIAFLDSDDMWIKEKLEKQIKKMINGDYKLCYTGGYLIDEEGKKQGSFLPKYENGYIFKKMLYRYEINNQSVLIERDVYRKFNENITIGEDYNLFMDIVFHHKVCNIKEKLIKYRIHKKSITKKGGIDLSDGVLLTLKDLDKKYNIKRNYPIGYLISWLKAQRFKTKYHIINNILNRRNY